MTRTSLLILTVILSLNIAFPTGAQTGGNPAGAKRDGKAVPVSGAVTDHGGKSASSDADAGEPGAGDAARAVADSVADADPLNYTRPVYSYRSEGRRDPFESLVPEVNKDEKKIKGLFNYEKAALRGIVRSGESVYAMAVDGDNYAYVLRENDPVLGGYVTKITDDAVQLHIVKYGRSMSIVLRMETAKKTLLARGEDDSVVRRPGITVAWGAERESGAVMTVEDVSVPSLDTKTVEEVWFGGIKKGGSADASSPYLLLSPSESAAVHLPAVLRWTKSPQDSLFTVVIARDSDFRTPLLVKEGVRGSTFLLESNPAPEYGGSFYWKVIALHRSGEQINSRNILSFRIQ